MGKNDNLISGVLFFLIVCIFLTTIYFCLDVFEIVEIPEEYSLARLFSTQTLEPVELQKIEAIVDETNIDEWMNNNQIEENISQNVIVETNVHTYENQTNDSLNENINNVQNRMYYSQLDVYGRIIYDEMYMNIDNLKTGTYTADFDTLFNDLLHEENGNEILEKAFQFSLNALLFDNPQIFYIDITKIYMSTEVTSFGPLKTYRVKIGPLEDKNYLYDCFQNEDEVNLAINKIETVRDYLASQIYGDTYNQIKIVHDYIISNTEYDQTFSNNNIYTSYGPLGEGYAVCEGYSKALKYILDGVGIPCVVVCGSGRNSSGSTESHAWNYVRLDGKWYAIDVTWDDPIIVGTGYVSQDIYKRHLLKGSLEFFEDHFEDGKIVSGSNFIYPTISEENYR